MSSLDPEMGALVADALRGVGIEVYVGERVEGFDTDSGRVTGVRTASTTLPADLVILGLGVERQQRARPRRRDPGRGQRRHHGRRPQRTRRRRDLRRR